MKLWKKVLFTSVVTVLVLAVLNSMAFLVVPRHSVFWNNPLMVMYPVDGFDPAVTLDAVHENYRPTRLARYVPDERRWYRLDPEPTIPEGELVLNFGDSSTWGWGLDDRGSAYSGELQNYLPADVHSVNLGVPGYSSLQGLRYVEELLPELRDRVRAITLYFGNNDSTENGAPDSALLASETGRAQVVLRRLALYRVLRELVPTVQSRNRRPRVSPEEYLTNMRGMIVLAQSYETPVVVIVPPVPVTWKPAHLTFTRSLEPNVSNQWSRDELAIANKLHDSGIAQLEQGNDEAIEALVQSVEHDWVVPRVKQDWKSRLPDLKQSDVSVISVQQPHPLAEYPYNFEDYCHPSAHLHQQIAALVAEVLESSRP